MSGVVVFFIVWTAVYCDVGLSFSLGKGDTAGRARVGEGHSVIRDGRGGM